MSSCACDVLTPEFPQGPGSRRNSHSPGSVEISGLYTLAKGQRQDPKTRRHTCLEGEGVLQTTGPALPESCALKNT